MKEWSASSVNAFRAFIAAFAIGLVTIPIAITVNSGDFMALLLRVGVENRQYAASLDEGLRYMVDAYGENGEIADLEPTIYRNGGEFQDWEIQAVSLVVCTQVSSDDKMFARRVAVAPDFNLSFTSKSRGLYEELSTNDLEWKYDGISYRAQKSLELVDLEFTLTINGDCLDPHVVIHVKRK